MEIKKLVEITTHSDLNMKEKKNPCTRIKIYLMEN